MRSSNKIIYLFLLAFIQCGKIKENAPDNSETKAPGNAIIICKGKTIESRFLPPPGFERKAVDENSFAGFLRALPLKPAGSKVKYFNGIIKNTMVYDAVVDMDIGTQDLQQCADAVMRLRAEYFYAQRVYDRISFPLTNGFKMDYAEWMKGKRVSVHGNSTSWQQYFAPSNNYKDFRNYMDFIFSYAGTLSLSKSLRLQNIKNISAGDVFIVGGSPGHAVIVVDIAENELGEKVFMLAQSYMPAQDIQVLKNPGDSKLSPWYSSDFAGDLVTPQWVFTINQLKTW